MMSEASGYPNGISSGGPYIQQGNNQVVQSQYEAYAPGNYVQQQEQPQTQQQQVIIGNYEQQGQFSSHQPQFPGGPQVGRYRHPQQMVRASKTPPQHFSPTSSKPQRSLIINSGGQRLLKVPQGNIRLVVQQQRPEGVYLKPGGASEHQGPVPRPVRMQQRQQSVRMVLQEPNNQHVAANNSPSWSGGYQEAPRQQIFQSPPTNEIAYNVEHVFMENGNEVKKMPIKFGDKTIWVDCVPGVAPENREDQVVFDLLEGEQSLMMSPSQTPAPNPPNNSQVMPTPVPQPSPQQEPMKMTESKEDKEKIVNAVLLDLISPTELSARHGISVAKIRDWVKATGNKLPSKYKVKYEKPKSGNNSLGNSPPSPMIKQQLPTTPASTPITPPAYSNNANRMQHPAVAVRPQFRFQTPPNRHPVPMAGQQQQMLRAPSEPHKLIPQQQLQPQQQQQRPQGVNIALSEGQTAQLSLNNTLTSVTTMIGGKQIVITKPALVGNAEAYKPRLVPGKLALCKNCGSTSPDFNKCIRCKKVMPETCKVIDDPNSQEKGGVTLHRTTTLELSTKVGDNGGIRIHPKQLQKKLTSEEPECIALSSDEEGANEPEESSDNTESNKESPENNGKSSPQEGMSDSKKDEDVPSESAVNGFPPVVEDPIQGDYIALSCRSIRIGSYKSAPLDKVMFTCWGIRLVVPSVEDPSVGQRLDIRKEELIQFLAHFGKGMPILFLLISIPACKRLRDLLGMESSSGLWLDVSSSDETHKRITILPDKMSEDARTILLRNYGVHLVKELGSKEANDILVRSSPKDASTGGPFRPARPRHPSIKYCTFPPSSSNSVSVSTEDYVVLEDESFLNDVIIDFYCRYLQYRLFSEADRERTHIFSTYFYNRLTSRPKKMKSKPHPIEDNPDLSPAEKRYERVKRWTKKVNLFEKDFVIIPINEHSHWFVAIICYPGQIGCRRMDNDAIVDPQVLVRTPKNASAPTPKPPMKRIVHIGSTTIIPIKAAALGPEKMAEEDLSDRDEADASDDEMMDEESTPRFNPLFGGTQQVAEENATAKPEDGQEQENKESQQEEEKAAPTPNEENRPPIKQPCILIFDSLATGSRARVAATLRDYLMCEHKAKRGEIRHFTKENMMGHCPKVPQQPNFSDCGIFLLQYVESFFNSPIGDYHLPITNLRNWFPTEIVRNKRSDIGKIIRELAEEQNPGKNLPFPNIIFSPISGSGYTDDEMEEEELGEEEDFGEEEDETLEEEEQQSGALLPDSTTSGAKEEEPSERVLAASLVDYSDSASDEMAPDSSVEGCAAPKRPLDEDFSCEEECHSEKKTKLDAS